MVKKTVPIKNDLYDALLLAQAGNQSAYFLRRFHSRGFVLHYRTY
jgi:hypothetical protein